MKKIITLALVTGLVVGSLAVSADAAKKKKKKKPKAVKTTMYMHGYSQVGEQDGAEWLANSLQGAAAAVMQMDGTKPGDGTPKSMNVNNPALNTQCAGLPAGFPTWQGNVAGKITGDIKLSGHFASAPGQKVTGRIWADTAIFSCNDGYVEPAAEVTVDVPAGQGTAEIVFEDMKLKPKMQLMVEIIGGSATTASRVLYDSTTAETKLEFSCVPAKGKTCLVAAQ
jgi:hypothetical protein